MLFNSIKYVCFLPVVLLIYFLIPAKANKYRNLFLLIASYFFYMCWIPQYAILIFISTISTYITSLMLDKFEKKNYRMLCLIINLILNFGILFTFKYYNFFVDNLNLIFNNLGLKLSISNNSLLLPVGISFYTFQAVGYSIDVYRRNIKAEKNFINYALFVSFFVQLVAGPIERANNLLPQFREVHKFNYSNAVKGMRMILIGMFKKVVIADTVAIFVNAVFNNVQAYTGLTLLMAIFLFSIQIYCDFSGYSDIAVGSAKMLGFRLMENFHAPYFSTSIGEFWNRWHISLNNWFKDYLYIPLGGSRKGFLRKCINLFIVFLLSGLWHGASWTFVIWGVLNGFYRLTQELIKKACKPVEFNYQFLYKIKNIMKIICTYGLICFSWIFFRANNIHDAIYIINNVFNNLSLQLLISNCYMIVSKNLIDISTMRYFYYGIIILGISILFIIDIIRCTPKNNVKLLEDIIFTNRLKIIRWVIYITFVLMIIWMFIIQKGIFGQTGEFIYFQF